jgi:hypothetical protein
MAKAQGRPINLGWSARRWKEEHDRLSRAEALARLAAENVLYDVSPFECRLPASFDGYLIRSAKRLGMEGLRQRHCVASYHSQLASGRCGIAVVFIGGKRWTVQLFAPENPAQALRLGEVRSRHNELPASETLSAIRGILGIPRIQPQTDDSRSEDGSHCYLATLRAVLPVLSRLEVQTVRVSFDGSGDEGAIEWIEYYPAMTDALETAMVEHPRGERRFDGGRWETVFRQTTQTIEEAIKELTYDYLEETDVDWYNNDGGYGALTIDVGRATVELEVNTRVVDSVTEFYRERDILTGEEI